MGIATFNDFLSRISNEYWLSQPIYADQAVSTTNPANILLQRSGWSKVMPSLPSGVTSYIPTAISLLSSVTPSCFLVGKLVNLGNINIATPTFTDGSAMPQRTVFNTGSVYIPSPIFCHVTTVLNATPGSLTITYVDQAGNTAEAGAALSLTASSVVNTVQIYPLNAGDWGVRDITTATRTGGTTPTGVITFYGIIPIALCQTTGAGGVVESLITYDFNFMELGAADEIGIFNIASNGAKGVVGHIFIVGDS